MRVRLGLGLGLGFILVASARSWLASRGHHPEAVGGAAGEPHAGSRMQGCACTRACDRAARASELRQRGAPGRCRRRGGWGARGGHRALSTGTEGEGRYFGPARARRSFQMTPPCSGSYLHLPEAALTVATAVFLGRGILMTTWLRLGVGLGL